MGSDLGLVRLHTKHPGLTAILVPVSNAEEDRIPSCHNNQRQVGARRPLDTRQIVSWVAHPKGCRFGLRFGSRQITKHPGLTAILVPVSNAEEDRTHSRHNKQRQVGARQPLDMRQIVSWVAPPKGCLPIWAQIWVSSGYKTPWPGGHPGLRLQFRGGQDTFIP